MPPAAFQKRNLHHGIRAMPAAQAAVKRRIADETAEEDDLAAVLRHQTLGLGEEAFCVAASNPRALEETASAEPPISQ